MATLYQTQFVLLSWACAFCSRIAFEVLQNVQVFSRLVQETQHSLAQLILLNGFLSNPNTPGVEKLVSCQVSAKWLNQRATKVQASDFGQSGLDPGRAFMV